MNGSTVDKDEIMNNYIDYLVENVINLQCFNMYIYFIVIIISYIKCENNSKKCEILYENKIYKFHYTDNSKKSYTVEIKLDIDISVNKSICEFTDSFIIIKLPYEVKNTQHFINPLEIVYNILYILIRMI